MEIDISKIRENNISFHELALYIKYKAPKSEGINLILGQLISGVRFEDYDFIDNMKAKKEKEALRFNKENKNLVKVGWY